MCRLSSTDGGLDLLEEFEEKETEFHWGCVEIKAAGNQSQEEH